MYRIPARDLARSPHGPATCPGCGRTDLVLVGALETLPGHTMPRGPLDPERNPDGTRARPHCPWSGDPLPGRPDGQLTPDGALRQLQRVALAAARRREHLARRSAA